MSASASFPSPTAILAHVIAVTIVLVFGIAIGLTAPCLPAIEGYFRPIATGSLVSGSVSRDDGKVCFSMHLHKQHAGEPIVYQYSVEVRQNEHWLASDNINAHVIDGKTGKPRDDYDNHPVGTRWDRRWCADLPASVSPWQVLRVSGYAVHRVHPLWETHSSMPSFTVPGVQTTSP